MKMLATIKTIAVSLVLAAFVMSQPTRAANSASDGSLVYNKTCYYCGIEEPCNLDFGKTKDNTRQIR